MSAVSFNDIVQTTLSSIQASVSVLLVLAYGYLTRKYEYLSQEAEHGISTLSVKFFLPSLLFSRIGPLATPSNLGSYWIIIVLSILNQFVAYLFGLVGTHAFEFPQWIVPCMIFNNATSLPLLLLETLAKSPSSALSALVTYPGDTVSEVAKRARVYFLVNALVANLIRFGFGPYLMKDQHKALWSHLESPHEIGEAVEGAVHSLEATASEAVSSLPTFGRHGSNGSGTGNGYPRIEPYPALARTGHEGYESDENAPLLSRPGAIQVRNKVQSMLHAFSTPLLWLNKWMNPPLWGGAAACLAGLVPFLRHWLFDQEGWMHPFTTSIENLGGLYTVLQMFVLGAHLKSKKGSRPPLLPMIYLFIFRFFAMPAISGGFVLATRAWLGGVVREDKALDFCLVLAPGGPPALTLAAIVEMSGEGDSTQSAVAQTILISYLLTPLISLSVAWAMTVVNLVYGKVL